MASALNQFNSISAIYDVMVAVVFGSTLHKAQCHFIEAIPTDSKILIMGGGTGKFLRELLKNKPESRVVYVEASSRMIAIAKRTIGEDARVTFIHGTQDSISSVLKVDVVITPFFLDLFSEGCLQRVMDQIKSSMVPRGIWIATDFTPSKKFWHQQLLWLMYRFFRLTTQIESKHLPPWENLLSKIAKQLDAKTFKNGFIKSTLYRINE